MNQDVWNEILFACGLRDNLKFKLVSKSFYQHCENSFWIAYASCRYPFHRVDKSHWWLVELRICEQSLFNAKNIQRDRLCPFGYINNYREVSIDTIREIELMIPELSFAPNITKKYAGRNSRPKFECIILNGEFKIEPKGYCMTLASCQLEKLSKDTLFRLFYILEYYS